MATRVKKKTAGKLAAEIKPERKLFKDWFDKSAATAMAKQIASVYSDFDSARFKRFALRDIESLEFNDRVKQFSEALHRTLPESYPVAVGILVDSLPVEASAASITCLLYTSPSPRDGLLSRMPSSA